MPNVATAEKMRNAFEALGVCADVVTGKMNSTDRKAVYERFNSGKCLVLVNCMVLTEGFDAPLTSCVIIGRPTLNSGLYVQCVGRGLRLADGKTDCLVLDVAGASLRHNLAGVNDLESDCNAQCDCGCLTCGCSDRCKCGIRQCGCSCIEQHEAPSTGCRCAGDLDNCGCGCEGDPLETGDFHCVCELNDDCDCRGEAPVLEDKEVAVEVLRNLVAVDILGEELAASTYTWLTTAAGIRYLPVGNDEAVFLLPSPEGDGYFQGLVQGTAPKAPVKRLDNGALPVQQARAALEAHAGQSGYTYNSRAASWRRTPASEAQKGLLRRMRVEFPEGVRKGEASDLLSNAKFSRCLDRFGSYVRTDA
jgi:hypothetical protein